MRVLSIVASLILLAGRQALGQASSAPRGSATPPTSAAGVEQQPFHGGGPTPVAPDDANRAQDEAAIRKLIADHNSAFDKHDGSATVYFTDDADTRNIVGKVFTGRAEIEKLGLALNKQWANVQRTETIEKTRFLTPDIGLVDSVIEARGYIVAENGTRLPPPAKVISSKVVVKREGRWLITAMRIAMPASATPNPQPQDVPTPTAAANHAEDEAAIRKIFADVTDAWNRHDVEGMTAAAHLSDDYDHINVAGNWTFGKAAGKRMKEYFATTRVPSAEQTILRLRFITQDVAICVNKLRYTRDQKTWEGISTNVLYKINGEWLNEAFQNTLIGDTKWDGNKLAVWARVSAAQSSAASEGNLFVGTWKLNLEKSKIAGPDGIRPLPLSKSIVTYEAVGDQMKISDDDTETNGRFLHMEWIGKFDGRDYPVSRDPSADTWSFEKINDRALSLATKKDGKVMATRHIIVSTDGRTRTLTGTRTDASGKTITVTAVYEKE